MEEAVERRCLERFHQHRKLGALHKVRSLIGELEWRKARRENPVVFEDAGVTGDGWFFSFEGELFERVEEEEYVNLGDY